MLQAVNANVVLTAVTDVRRRTGGSG